MRKAIIVWLTLEASGAAIGLAWPWAVVYLHAPNYLNLVPAYLVRP